MAHYLIDLFEDSLKKVSELKLAPKAETLALTFHLNTQLTAVNEVLAEPEDSERYGPMQEITQHAESIIALLDAAPHGGAFVNAFELLKIAIHVRVMHRQESDPVFLAQEAARNAAAPLPPIPDSLREGYTGPPVEPQPVEMISGLTRVEAVGILNFGTLGLPNGFFTTPNLMGSLNALQAASIHRGRPEAEVDATFKQLVVYAVISYEGNVLLYKRGKPGAEARLHAKHSIGVGGHMEPGDFAQMDEVPAFKALYRELREECGILPGHINSTTFCGFVNNEADDVGQVHLGLVFLVELDNVLGCEFERAMVEPTWFAPGEIEVPALETWSAMILPSVIAQFSTEVQPTASQLNPQDPDSDLDEPLGQRKCAEGEVCESCQ